MRVEYLEALATPSTGWAGRSPSSSRPAMRGSLPTTASPPPPLGVFDTDSEDTDALPLSDRPVQPLLLGGQHDRTARHVGTSPSNLHRGAGGGAIFWDATVTKPLY